MYIKKDPDFFSQQVLEANRFYLDAHFRKNHALKVVCGGRERCKPNYRIDRPSFPFYSIEFVARGKGTVTLNNTEYDLYTGRIFSYGPGIAHVMSSEADDPLVKYFVDFIGSDAPKMLSKFALAPGRVVQVSSPEVILQIFEDLIKNGQADSRYSLLLCKAILEQLILKIAETSIVENSRTSAAFCTYQSIRDVIQKNYMNLRSLEQIAEECNIDSAYLCRLFKRFDKRSPYQYLMRLKMNFAAQRLLLPNSSVKEIAFELGFSDPFHFSRVFKRILGISPSTFKSLR
ncbi:MAG: AraC family transcriptional regulator [Sedimentisphaerales bacterium]|nr:AraC family transcriptional regulator [Sedimentisphaerales bacterium]